MSITMSTPLLEKSLIEKYDPVHKRTGLKDLTIIFLVGKIQLSKVCSRLTNDKYPKLLSTSFLNRYILIQCAAIIFYHARPSTSRFKKGSQTNFLYFCQSLIV